MARIIEPMLGWIGIHSAAAVTSISFSVGYFIISFLHIVVGEMAPKSMAIVLAESTALWIAWPLHLFYMIFLPFIWLLNTCSLGIVRLFGVKPTTETGEATSLTEEEFRILVARSAKIGNITQAERLLVENVLDFSDKQARQIMVPRTEVCYLNVEEPLDKLLQRVVEYEHTRLPLCAGDLDHVIGIVNVKDIYRQIIEKKDPDASLRQIARQTVFVPESIPLDRLLIQFQQKRVHLAVVLDEYGGTSGIVTLENVLEELVGQILDEFDKESLPIQKISPREWIAEGQCPLSVLKRATGLLLTTEDAATVGGLVIALAGKIPSQVTVVHFPSENVSFRVESSNPRKVIRVKVILEMRENRTPTSENEGNPIDPQQ